MRWLILGVVALGSALGCGFTSPVIWNLLTGNKGPAFDRVFLSMMIPHYQGLMEIQSAFLPQIRDPALQALVQESIAADKARIATFHSQLRGLHGEALKVMQTEMGKDIAVMKANLLVGKEPHSVFASLIMANSASATGMANLAKERSQNGQVLRIARELVGAEQLRTEQFQVWLIEQTQ
jgi:uncharacterized protein (DUF305 family)